MLKDGRVRAAGPVDEVLAPGILAEVYEVPRAFLRTLGAGLGDEPDAARAPSPARATGTKPALSGTSRTSA